MRRNTQSDMQLKILAVVKFDLSTGCWLYVGEAKPTPQGYAPNHLGHRKSYWAFRGEIPEGLTLDHDCEVKLCLNPWHLVPMTLLENVEVYCKKMGRRFVPNRQVTLDEKRAAVEF